MKALSAILDFFRPAPAPAPALEAVDDPPTPLPGVMTDPEPAEEEPDEEEPIVLHWLERSDRDILYSFDDVVRALATGQMDEFGIYDVRERRVVLPATDRGSLVLAIHKYRPPRYYFAYRIRPEDPYTPLFLVMDA